MRPFTIAALMLALSGCDSGGGGSADGGLDGGPDAFGDAGDAGDSAFDGDSPDVGMAAEEAVDLEIEAACRRAVLCGDSEALHRLRCHPTERARAQRARIEAIARGDLSVDPASVEACRASAEATTCAEADATCGALVARRTVGEVCGHPDACQMGTCTGIACPTVCTVGLPADAPCAAPSDCGPGLTCSGGSCVARTAEDEPCSGPLECIEGTVCDGTCRALTEADEGEPCDAAAVCAPWLFCVGGVCAIGAADGEPCDFDRPCHIEASCESGSCVPRVLPGASCDDSVRCPRSHACVGDTCAPRPSVGDACGAESTCSRGACIDGTCTLREGAQICDGPSECRSGICARDLCQAAPAIGAPCVGGCADGGQCRFVPGEPRLCRPVCL